MPRKRKSLSASPQRRASLTGSSSVPSFLAGLPHPLPAMSNNRTKVFSNMCEMFPNLDPSLVEMVLNEYKEVETVMDYLLELSTSTKGNTPESTGFTKDVSFLDDFEMESQVPENFHDVCDELAEQPDASYMDGTVCNDLDMLLDEALDKYGLNGPDEYQDTELYHTTNIHHTSCHTGHSSVGDQSKADLQSEDHTCASDSDFGSVEYDTGADLGVAEPDRLLTEVDEPHTLPSSPTSHVKLQTASPKSQIKWNPLASSFYPVSNVNPAFIAPVAFNPLQWSSIAGTRPPVAGVCYNPPTFVWNFNHFPQTHRNTEYIKPINTAAQSGPQVLKKVTPYVGKVLVLLRGAPGSGKSTLARLILGQNPAGVILSTDDYFSRGGEYQYDITSLGEAHEWNHKRAKDAFEKKISPIIIDNTNLQAWEMKPYVSMAVKYKYKVTFREPDTWWRCKPKELERRNHHGVKKEKIMKMLENFERVSVNSMLNLSHPKASKNANNSQRKIRERTREPSILPQIHKEEASFSLSTDTGNMADIDSADQATQESVEVSRDGPEILFDVAKSEIKNLTTAESDNCMDLFQVVQNISDNEVQGNDDSGIEAAADNPGPDIESGTSPINERPELFNFVGDWPVEQTMSQRAPRNKKPRTRQEKPIPCEQGSNEATNPDEEQIDKVIEQIDNRSSEENQMKEAAAVKMEPNIDFSTVDDNEEHLLGLGKELCISLPVHNKEDCTEEGDSEGACSNKIHNEDCTEEGDSGGACSNKIHNEDCTKEGDSEGACSNRIHNEDCTKEGDSEGACSNKMHNEDCTEEGDSEGACSNKIHNEDCTEEGDSEGACSNKIHNEDCTEEGDSKGACSNKMHNEDCTEEGDSEGACSNRIHNEDCTEEGNSEGACSNKIQHEDCMEEGDSEGVCSSKMSNDQEQVAECSIEGEDIQSTNEDVKIKKPRRNSRNCRLALNFTHKCAISSKHEESECFQQPNVGLCRFTQTEPQDFAVAWRIERRNVDVSDSVKVLKGISSRFISKSLDGSSDIRENIPYRVAHHKSTFVEEDDIIRLGDQDGLDILCKLFRSLSFDILKDLFERCNKDIVWTTNLLLDSGEKIYKDEECETEESDNLESCFYSDKDNNSVMIEEKSILVLEEDCENVETDFTEQCVAEYSPFVNALPLVVAEEMKNGNVLSSNESILGQQCRIPAELQEIFPNYETITDTMAPDLMWPSDFEADYPNALDSSLDIFQSCNTLNPIKKGNTEEIPIDHEDLSINSDMYLPDILVEDNEEFLEVTEPAQEQQKTQNKSISGPQAKESLHFNYLELALPPEFAFQLTELFGPVGINPGSLTIEDCVVPIDLKLAESIHKKWKESILERHRQEALSYLLTEYGVSNDPANLCNIVEKSESGVSQRETEPLPFMDHWNIRAKKVSLREIIAEEMALQAHEDSKKSSSSKNCAVKMKEKQLLELFPNIEQQLLLDIFKENNYSLEKTEQFMSSVLEADPVQNVIAQGFQLPVSTVTEKNKEKKLKADNEILSERERYFQDLKFPNYGDFRAEAFLYHQKQQESYRKAAEAHNRGMKQVAAYYAQQGYLYGQKMKEENLRAAVKIFERSNEYLLPENILDLHGLHVDEAMKHLRTVLQDKAEEFKQNGGKSYLLVITGRGNHSQGGVPRIKPAVIDFLTNHDYRFQEKTPGVLRVTLK